jgi:hypothetical protein
MMQLTMYTISDFKWFETILLKESLLTTLSTPSIFTAHLGMKVGSALYQE